jgi:endonuclease YncB( thermonuclease family)
MIVDSKRKNAKAPPLRRQRPRSRSTPRRTGGFRWVRRGYGRLYVMLLALLAYGFWAGGEPEILAGRVSVIDGDTLRLGSDSIRLRGIDAPEIRQFCGRGGLDYRCGADARDHLIGLIGSNPVECTVTDTDRYARKVARCLSNGRDLGLEMVRAGHAIADGAYEQEEAAARRALLGIWEGEFERPDAWRATFGEARSGQDE